MNEQSHPTHYVCTRNEAINLIERHDRFWVCNCGCREGAGNCQRSRIDLCLTFRSDAATSGSGNREISKSQAQEIILEAKEKHLVSRPFRDSRDITMTEGICFCCDDCCGYFLNHDEKCDKGAFAEWTSMDKCSHCGVCVDVCFFKAREMKGDIFRVLHDNCYGCGLCVDVCPEECIRMIPVGEKV